MARETFQVGDLTAVIGDNEAYESHRAGYNGVHRLTHRTNPKPLFTVTGLNLEHIFRFAPVYPDVRPDGGNPLFAFAEWRRASFSD